MVSRGLRPAVGPQRGAGFPCVHGKAPVRPELSRCPSVRIPKAAARKRRLAVLRQLASGEGAIDLTRNASVENAESAGDFSAACGATLPLRLSIRNERTGE